MNQTELIPMEQRAASFSPDRAYRYTLDIVWNPDLPLVQFIGLNPSTADEVKDDPTIRKCKQFSKNWGYGGMVMTNIFAFRATDPRVMKSHPSPIGELNNEALTSTQSRCVISVAAWGNHGTHMERGIYVASLLTKWGRSLKCFRITKGKCPEHPLYMPYGTPLIDFAQ